VQQGAKTVSRILQLHCSASKAASEEAAGRHIVARQREHQSLKALARFAGVPLAMVAPGGLLLPSSGSTSPTDCVQQLESYVQYRIALARSEAFNKVSQPGPA
jgi:hypothetical protein